MPTKKWTACRRGNCRAHRIACFRCERIADEFCERHASAGATKSIGGKRYCARSPPCQRDLERWRKNGSRAGDYPAREFDKACFTRATCPACGDGEIVGECAGRQHRACPSGEFSELCARCSEWSVGLDERRRCRACHAICEAERTCESCRAVTAKKFSCAGCGKKACDACDSKTVVDVSPMKISRSIVSYSIAMYETMCGDCMSKTTVEAVQDKARRELERREARRGW